MNKNQKLAIGVSSSFLVVVLVVLSLVSSAGPTPSIIPVASNSGVPVCEARDDFWEYNADANSWTEKASFEGGNRISAVAFSIAEIGYITTGEYEFNNSTVYTKDLWAWDSETNSWTQKVSLPVEASARSGAAGFAIGRRGYVGTGGNEYGGLKDFWEYDGDIDSNTYNTWKQKAPFGGVARTAAVGFQIPHQNGNKGYIGTGIAQDGMKQDFWEWDQNTNTWVQKANFDGGARIHAIAFTLNNKGYVGTGKGLSGYTKDFWQYDQASNSWTQKADFGGEERTSAVGFASDAYGYIGTGATLSGRKADFWAYDQALNSWTQRADYAGGATDNAIGFSIRNTGYLGTGFRCEEEPPLACTPNTWNRKADFLGAGRWQAEGLSISTNGKGYIGMGTSSTVAALKDFWEWDQALNTWTPKMSLTGPSRVDPVGFSIGSKGYYGTGGDGNVTYYKDFWEWDQATNVWTQKAVFPGTGRRSASGFVIGNKGYIGTGVNDNLGVAHFKDFYEWNQATNTWTAKATFPGAARSTAVGFTIGTKGYMGTGADYSSSYSDFYEFNPSVGALGTWTKKTDFQGVTRGQAAGFSLVGLDGNTYGYIGTGAKNNYVQAGSALKDFWRFNPTGSTTGWPAGSGLWERKADFGGTARINAAAFSLNNKGYIGTGLEYGNSINYTKDFWEYCPD